MRSITAAAVLALLGVFLSGQADADEGPASKITDSRLKTVTEYVLKSDKYLHQSKLRRGMQGYGLTVLQGTKIEKFEVTVISVIENYFGVQRDAILVRLSGLNIEEIGLISGMSGSPIYMPDPDDGKFKLVGAFAFGWTWQKEAVGGVQPISQMLAVAGGALEELLKAEGKSQPDAPATRPEGEPASQAETPRAKTSGPLDRAWREAAFAPQKGDFGRFNWPERMLRPAAPAPADQMRPLALPLMVGGMTDVARDYLTAALSPMNIIPVQAGSAGKAPADQVDGLKLEPGGSLSIPLVTGDEDISAVGTVTDVIGDHVLGFGHSMFGDGTVELPMATGYVHTVLAAYPSSFKLASNIRVVGELTTDENTAVGGVVGRKVDLMPVTVEVTWADTGQTQTYKFNVIRDRYYTPLLVNIVTMDSLLNSRYLPIEHSIEYETEADFGKLGVYKVSNLSSASDIDDVISDTVRPVAAMMNNSIATARVESVRVKATIHKGDRLVRILGVTLDRNNYAPGDTVRATVHLHRYRGDRFDRTVELKLPGDLDDGVYPLSVGDAMLATMSLQRAHPQKFDPRDLAQILEAVQLSSEARMDRLYAILDLPTEGLSLRKQELPDAPGTLAAALKSADPLNVTPLGKTVSDSTPVDFVVIGRTTVKVVVSKNPPRP